MELIVSDFGSYVGKKSARLVVKRRGDLVEQVPFRDLSRVVIDGRGISLSSDAIYHCMEHGVQIDFLSFGGQPFAKLSSPSLGGTVVTRREQLLAFDDERGLHIARAMVEGKLRNQVNVMKYFAKSRREDPQGFYQEVRDYARIVGQLRADVQHEHRGAGRTHVLAALWGARQGYSRVPGQEAPGRHR